MSFSDGVSTSPSVCATTTISPSSRAASSIALMLAPRPTESGVTWCGKNTALRRGSTGRACGTVDFVIVVSLRFLAIVYGSCPIEKKDPAGSPGDPTDPRGPAPEYHLTPLRAPGMTPGAAAVTSPLPQSVPDWLPPPPAERYSGPRRGMTHHLMTISFGFNASVFRSLTASTPFSYRASTFFRSIPSPSANRRSYAPVRISR